MGHFSSNIDFFMTATFQNKLFSQLKFNLVQKSHFILKSMFKILRCYNFKDLYDNKAYWKKLFQEDSKTTDGRREKKPLDIHYIKTKNKVSS